MTDNTIKLEKDNILRLEIVTSEGVPTGEYLEFDLEDVELPLKYQELIEKESKNTAWLQNQLKMIRSRKDIKGKKALTKNQEDEFKAMQTFIERETEIYNMFLGENGVQKLLNGRKLGWNSLPIVNKIIEEQIMPRVQQSVKDVVADIEKKYGPTIVNNIMNANNILKDE